MKRSLTLLLFVFSCSEINTPVAPPAYPSRDFRIEYNDTTQIEFRLWSDEAMVSIWNLDVDTGLPVFTLYLRTDQPLGRPLEELNISNSSHVFLATHSQNQGDHGLDISLLVVDKGRVGKVVGYRKTSSRWVNDFFVRIPLSPKEMGFPDNIAWQLDVNVNGSSRIIPTKPGIYFLEREDAYRPIVTFKSFYQFVGTPFGRAKRGEGITHKVGLDFENPAHSPEIDKVYWKTSDDKHWRDSVDALDFEWTSQIPADPDMDCTRIIIQAVNRFGYRSLPDTSRVLWELHKPIDFRSLGPANFYMGCDYEVDGHRKHRVRLSQFEIMTTEVTREMYDAVMASKRPSYKALSRMPADSVTWYDAVHFCNRLSKISGLDTCYVVNYGDAWCDFSKNGYRLPTGAEWEYACRAGSEGQYWTVNGEFIPENDLDTFAWWISNSELSAHTVGRKKPNQFGLFDMIGNVAEWCNDWYETPYEQVFVRVNPTGHGEGTGKEVRGGAYNSIIGQVELHTRIEADPERRSAGIGFRCARSLGEQ